MSSTPEQRLRAKFRKYGMTPEDYEDMLWSQDGGCAICGVRKPGGNGEWHIDHDHQTGVVRGLLCAKCNMGLGLFQDSQEHLTSAILYLAEPRPDAPRTPARADRKQVCDSCGESLVQPNGVGRPKRFCSDRCRTRFRRALTCGVVK